MLLPEKPYENRALAIAKFVVQIFITALLIIPASIVWLAGKGVTYFSATRVSEEGLSIAPPLITFPVETAQDKSLNINLLSQKFNQAFPGYNYSSKRSSFERFCRWVANKDLNIFPGNRQKRTLFCDQMGFLLRGIIKKINSGEVSTDKERGVLIELAEASSVCYPTWLEVTTKLFKKLNGQEETVEVKLLRMIQEYKETIILEFAQNDLNGQWHALNYVRNILGFELGLNTQSNAFDPYAGNNVDSVFGKGLTKWIFMQRYENANRLITSIHTMINFQPYDSSYHTFLVGAVKQQKIQNPEDYVAENFYTDDYKIKETAVNLMLRCIGVLTSAKI